MSHGASQSEREVERGGAGRDKIEAWGEERGVLRIVHCPKSLNHTWRGGRGVGSKATLWCVGGLQEADVDARCRRF